MKLLLCLTATSSLLALTPAIASSDLVRDLAKCSSEANGVKRLACFDDLSKRAGALPKTLPLAAKGKWAIEEKTNKIDDSRTITARVMADSPITGWPRKTFVPVLFVRCQSNKTEVFIANGMSPLVEYGSDGATITIRFDKERARKLTTSKSTDGEALFLPNPVQFLKDAEKHEAMLYEFIPFNSSPATTSFPLTGLPEVIKSVRSTCKW